MPKKDPEEELKDQLKRRPKMRPTRTRCEKCGIDFPSNYALVQHARQKH